MTQKHTPGPWLSVSGEDKYHGVEIETEKGCFMATKDDLVMMATAPALQKALETLLLRWEDYIHLIDQNDNPAYKAQAIDYGNQARALIQSLKG